LAALTAQEQYAAMELFRGTMVRHGAVVYRKEQSGKSPSVDFDRDAWLGYVPIRLPDTLTVRDRDRLPAGASAVLINRNHTYNDLYLPIDEREERLLAAVDGESTIGEICNDSVERDMTRWFFQRLWQWDQVVFSLKKGAVET
jgi:hypothetical protein